MIQEPDRYPAGLNAGTLRKLDRFAGLISEFVQADRKGADALELATGIIERTEMLKMYLHDSTPENLSKQENLQELISGVKGFVETRVEEGVTACRSPILWRRSRLPLTGFGFRRRKRGARDSDDCPCCKGAGIQ